MRETSRGLHETHEPIELVERGAAGPYVQSRRKAVYREIFERLFSEKLIYPCVCSRAEYAAVESAPHAGDRERRYPGTCRGRFSSIDEARTHLRGEREPVWRLRVPEGSVTYDDLLLGPRTHDPNAEVGDFPVFKSPDHPYYQLATAADDAVQGITRVIRGDDLVPSTARQLLILRALGLPEPRYGHAPLVIGPDGKRIAKRHGDSRIRTLRDLGVDPRHVVGRLALWSGLGNGSPARPEELLERWKTARPNLEKIVLTREELGELERVS